MVLIEIDIMFLKVIDCILQLNNFKEDEFIFGIKNITATTLQTKCNTNVKKLI